MTFPVEPGGSRSPTLSERESHFVVFAGAPVEDPRAVAAQLGEFPLSSVAADGGLRLCRALGLWPQVLVGDLDTLSASEVQECEQRGIEVLRHPEDKDQSDLELALLAAQARGASRVSILGALGGDWDHSLHNLLAPLSLCARLGMWARLVTERAQIYLITEEARLNDCQGCRVSLASLSQRVEALTLEGFQYPLHEAVMYRYQTRGLANQVNLDQALISMGSGELLLTLLS